MKTLMVGVGLFLFGQLTGLAQGYIVLNGVTYTGSSFGDGGYGINVVHNPTNGESTGFSLIPLGKTLPTTYTNTFSFDAIVDVSVRVFLVSSNQAINTNTLLSGSLTELLLGSSYVFTNNQPFYVALYTGNQSYYPPDGIYSDPLFGWAELVNNQGVIQLLAGAMEYGGTGIYAGTQNIIQAVPEPTATALTAVAGLFFLARRKFRPADCIRG